MPTRKIDERAWPMKAICLNPDHTPPTMMVFEPGLYEHECPDCGHKTRFRVEGFTLSAPTQVSD